MVDGEGTEYPNGVYIIEPLRKFGASDIEQRQNETASGDNNTAPGAKPLTPKGESVAFGRSGLVQRP